MSIARHHNEWLTLVPNSGPFLSLPVLMQVFPQGLNAHDADHARRLRSAFGEWDDDQSGARPDPAIHREWIKLVLAETLGFEELLAEGQDIPQTLKSDNLEYGETLRPNWVVNDPGTKKARLLVLTYPRSQLLTKPVHTSRCKDSPDTRMMQLLHDTSIRLGIITNGDHWMLVNAPKGQTSGYASWYANLWLEESLTLRAFRTLLCAERFFGVPDTETLDLEKGLLDRSADDQQEVTDQLGYQVRKAVEVLIQSLDKADQDHGRKLLADVDEKVLYESALTVMMRLVFLFCAEEKELLLLGDELWDENYAVSTLREQLREAADQHGEEILGLRYDAWTRLLTTFRVVYAGVKHDRFKLPAYGGSLFNPDRFPLLEGRLQGTSWKDTEATPLPVSNRTVLHLLEALQVLQVRLPGGGPAEARKLSFRWLGIEQIGHVYEGLLDHTAKRAGEPFLGLQGTRDKEPEISLAELEKVAARGEKELLKFLKDETGRSESALKNGLKAEIEDHLGSRFRTVCQDSALSKRVQKFAGLVRLDTTDYPVVITKGSVFVTAGTDRRSSGTHYTPKSLTEPIVQNTLEPLVYFGPAEGLPRSQWRLKTPTEILNLKICDMACGSGAFLVQVCRYLAARLQEAWLEMERAVERGEVKLFQPPAFAKPDEKSKLPEPRTSPFGFVSEGKPQEQLLPASDQDREILALRLIAQRCLYGVDKNPLAVEMAKLSLWLLTLAKDKPFEFLDHAIRCGDSLVGIHKLDQLRKFNLDGMGEDNNLFLQFLDPKIKEAIELRRRLESMEANTVEDVEAQERLLREADEKIERLKCAADLLIAADFTPGSAAEKRGTRDDAAIKVSVHFHDSDGATFRSEAQTSLNGQPTFHWPLEFPEVMVERGGFDAFVGNPPFLGGRRISFRLGSPYFAKLKSEVGESVATTDLCVYFLLRAFKLLAPDKCLGFVLSDVVSQGDSRENGLLRILNSGGKVFHAISTRHWPGTAGVKIAHVHVRKGNWIEPCILNDRPVSAISSFLREEGQVTGDPHPLLASTGICFTGHYLMGQGFVVSSAEADGLSQANPANAEVIFPYIRGDDINNEPTQATDNRAINFGMLGLDEIEERYPECLERVRSLVKPERDEVKRKANRERWWRYAEARPGLHVTIADLEEVIVQPFTAKYLNFSYVPSRCVFAHPLVVATDPSLGRFAVLLSCFHEAWVREYCSTSLDLMRYTASRVFDTFPFPDLDPLTDHGRRIRKVRDSFRVTGGQSLNDIYNLVHDPAHSSEKILKLRQLHVEVDNAVAAAYGWTDLDLGHGFHETKQGVRYTISELAHREVLDRLLRLNHKRYKEEEQQGLQEKEEKKGSNSKNKGKPKASGPSLYDEEEDE